MSIKRMKWPRSKRFTILCVGGVVVALVTLLLLILGFDKPVEEPFYQGRSLRGWIKASAADHQDRIIYQRTALLAMGHPAIQYLDFIITHPRRMIEGHTTAVDKNVLQLGEYVPQLLPWMSELIAPPQNRIKLWEVLVSVRLIGSNARNLAPDVARLWESDGQLEYKAEDLFPLALAELGDTSPEILDSLHRHFTSPNRRHRAVCAFAAWKLNPSDTKAIEMLKIELTSTDQDAQPRYSLLEILARWGGTNVAIVLPETRALIAAPLPSKGYQFLVAAAATRIFKTNEPSQ
jgi:hypothetical protein